MKKISIFITGCLLVLSVYASAMQPQVILRTGTNYDVKVDGNLYAGGSVPIPNLNQGMHTVEVYEVSRTGVLINTKRRVLIYSSSFELRNNDVIIEVNPNNQVRIYESNKYNPVIQPGNGNDNNRDWQNNQCRDRDDNNNNNQGNRGRGHKYGHYKKMKHCDKCDNNSDNDKRKEKDD